MARFKMTVLIEQLVVRKIKLDVDALDDVEAVYKAEQAVQTFPRAIMQEGVHRMLAVEQEYQVPHNFEVLDLREDKKYA